MIAYLVAILLLFASVGHTQLVSHQEWQTATLTSDTLTVGTCYDLLLPHQLGRPLSEPAATSSCGEMCQSLSSSHPVRVAISPQIGTTDNLSTITGCLPDGSMIQVITANSGDVITVKHGVGNIELPNDTDILLNDITVPLRLIRKGGIFIVDASSGGGGGGGGIASIMGNTGPTIVQLTMLDGHGIDMSGCSPSAAGECFVLPKDATCLTMATEGQLCYSAANDHIYFWNGTTAVDLSASATLGLEDAAQNGRAITSANSQGNAVVIGDGNDGFRIYTGAQGPVIECFVGAGTCDYVINVASGDNFILNLNGTPQLTISSAGAVTLGTALQEIRSIPILAGALTPDGTQCTRGADVTLNAELYDFTITCSDISAPTIKVAWMSNDAWDFASVQVRMGMQKDGTGVDNNVAWDWVAYCASSGDTNGHNTYPSPTGSGNNRAIFDGSTFAVNDYISAQTSNITLSGSCAAGDWISVKGFQNTTATTATSTNDLHILGIQVRMNMIKWSD